MGCGGEAAFAARAPNVEKGSTDVRIAAVNTAIGAARATISVLVFMAVLVAAGPATGADPKTERAREHFQLGDAYFKLEKYASALQEFEQAYLAKPDASFLYNIAQCHRLMGSRVEAVRFYRRYINEAPNAANRGVAEKHIKELETSLVDTPAPSGHSPPIIPPPGPSSSPTSPSAIPAPAPSQAPASGSQSLALQAPPPPQTDVSHTGAIPAEPSPSSSDDQPIYTKWWFWTGVGAVVVGGIVTALLLGRDPACPAGRTCQ